MYKRGRETKPCNLSCSNLRKKENLSRNIDEHENLTIAASKLNPRGAKATDCRRSHDGIQRGDQMLLASSTLLGAKAAI